MTGDAPPRSRWLIRESGDRLAASHDAVSNAIATLARSAVIRDSASAGPTIRQRIAGRRGWPRTIWLGLTTALTGLFLAWISVRLLRHLSSAPDVLAVLPGLLLTLALAGPAMQVARALDRRSESGPSALALPWTFFASAAASSVAWIILCLVVTTSTAPWIAVTCGTALVAAIGAGMLASSRPEKAPATATAIARRVCPIPRRLRTQRLRAQLRLRDHTRLWNLTAHQYGAAIADSSQAANALARLLAGDADPPLDGIGSYDVLILTTLRKYHPAALAANLDAAVRRLNDVS